MSTYERYSFENWVFVFKIEDDQPDMLHIWARHLKTENDAIRIWLEGTDTWNAENNRFETTLDSEHLYWFWLEEDKVIMVISCFEVKVLRDPWQI